MKKAVICMLLCLCAAAACLVALPSQAKATPETVALTQYEEALTLSEDTCLDLNGFGIGTLTVEKGVTAQIMDSQTDDYTVEDGVYGRIGRIAAVKDAVAAKEGYLMITEKDGTSFHRLNLNVDGVTLRTKKVGIYYRSQFGGDEVIKRNIVAYGTALGANMAPDFDENTYTRFTDMRTWKTGMDAQGNANNLQNGTVLEGIMREKNGFTANSRNANTQLYCQSYVELPDGTRVMGDMVCYSLKQVMEGAEGLVGTDSVAATLSDPDKLALKNMYWDYRNVMKYWDIPNTKAVVESNVDDGVFRVLMIGQSHAQDTVWLLEKVLSAHMPDQEFLVVDMYESTNIAQHIKNIKANAAVYDYCEGKDGVVTVTNDVTVEYALEKYQWDLIAFNEATWPQTETTSFTNGNIQWLTDYIAAHAIPGYKLAYNATWAQPVSAEVYAKNRRQPPEGFRENFLKKFDGDRLAHFDRICNNIKTYVETDEDYDIVFHSGTAIQYASETLGVAEGDPTRKMDLYRDYTHLSDFGRLIVAYQWYAQIFGLEALTEVKVDMIADHLRATTREQAFGDLEITDAHKQIIIDSVNYALKNPNVAPPQLARQTAILEPLG